MLYNLADKINVCVFTFRNYGLLNKASAEHADNTGVLESDTGQS